MVQFLEDDRPFPSFPEDTELSFITYERMATLYYNIGEKIAQITDALDVEKTTNFHAYTQEEWRKFEIMVQADLRLLGECQHFLTTLPTPLGKTDTIRAALDFIFRLYCPKMGVYTESGLTPESARTVLTNFVLPAPAMN